VGRARVDRPGRRLWNWAERIESKPDGLANCNHQPFAQCHKRAVPVSNAECAAAAGRRREGFHH
jgi:hypothetical protein